MILKDLLKTLNPNLLVEIGRMDGSPIITTRAKSWRCLDDGLLMVPVSSVGGASERDHSGAVTVILAVQWPIAYVSTIGELQAAMDDDEVCAVALTADIAADDDMTTLLTFNSTRVKSLDLNGYMLAASNSELTETVTAIEVTGGVLNIYDSQGGGEVFGGKYARANHAVRVGENSMCNIYGGYYTVASLGDNPEWSATVYTDGDVNIYGGYFENESFNFGSRAVLDGNLDNIVCYGGMFDGYDVTDLLAKGKRVEESQRYYTRLFRVVGK